MCDKKSILIQKGAIDFVIEAIYDSDEDIKFNYHSDTELWVGLSNKVASEYNDFLVQHHKSDSRNLAELKQGTLTFDRSDVEIRCDPFLIFIASKYKNKKNDTVAMYSVDENEKISSGEYILWGWLEDLQTEKPYKHLLCDGLKIGDKKYTTDWKPFFEKIRKKGKNISNQGKKEFECKNLNELLQNRIDCDKQIQFLVYVIVKNNGVKNG